jgi:hypothetical protein
VTVRITELANAKSLDVRDGSVFVCAVMGADGRQGIAISAYGDSGQLPIAATLDEHDLLCVLTALREAATAHGWSVWQ